MFGCLVHSPGEFCDQSGSLCSVDVDLIVIHKQDVFSDNAESIDGVFETTRVRFEMTRLMGSECGMKMIKQLGFLFKSVPMQMICV